SATGMVAPCGPYHFLKCSGSVHICHTSSTGASKLRSITTESWLVTSSVIGHRPFVVAVGVGGGSLPSGRSGPPRPVGIAPPTSKPRRAVRRRGRTAGIGRAALGRPDQRVPAP